MKTGQKLLTAVLVGVAAIWALLFLLLGLFLKPADPNQEMARTAREAIQLARQAQQEAGAARARGSAVRILALVVGVSTPLVLVYLLFRLRLKEEPTLSEILRVLERENLIRGPEDLPRQLQHRATRLLKDQDAGHEES